MVGTGIWTHRDSHLQWGTLNSHQGIASQGNYDPIRVSHVNKRDTGRKNSLITHKGEWKQQILATILKVICAMCSVIYGSLWPPWTVTCQDPLSTEFSRQEYWSGLPFPTPGNLPNPGIGPTSLALAGGFFTIAPPGNHYHLLYKGSY